VAAAEYSSRVLHLVWFECQLPIRMPAATSIASLGGWSADGPWQTYLFDAIVAGRRTERG
jgi:hypothetical protein